MFSAFLSSTFAISTPLLRYDPILLISFPFLSILNNVETLSSLLANNPALEKSNIYSTSRP